MKYPARWECAECGNVVLRDDMWIERSPFDPEESIVGCRECLSCESFVELCDEPECLNLAVGGTPTKDGYRRLCSEHLREILEPTTEESK